MPRVSRWLLIPRRLDLIKEDFWSAITLLENKREVREFLSVFLTPDERTMLAKRFRVMMMLVEEESYQNIRNGAHVSKATISRLYGLLQDDSTGLIKSVAERIVEIKRKKLGNEVKPRVRRAPGDLAGPLAQVVARKVSGMVFDKRKRGSA